MYLVLYSTLGTQVMFPPQSTDLVAEPLNIRDQPRSTPFSNLHRIKPLRLPLRPLLQPCLSPTSLVGPIGSDPESDGQVRGNGCEGFGEVINQCPEEDAKCLRFTRLRVRSLYRNKLP